ncbi:unnamed protein product, partial [Menidia menidia]
MRAAADPSLDHRELPASVCVSLQAANSSSAHGLELLYGQVGGGFTMECSFSTSGWGEVKSLCREKCDGGNKLIQTKSNAAEKGRYRIQYSEKVLSVSISGLTRYDSGRYRCAVGRSSHIDVELVVAEGSGSKKLFCRGDCWHGGEILAQTDGVRAEKGRYRIGFVDKRFAGGVLYVSITQLNQSDSGRYRCYLDRIGPDGSTDFSIQVSA